MSHFRVMDWDNMCLVDTIFGFLLMEQKKKYFLSITWLVIYVFSKDGHTICTKCCVSKIIGIDLGTSNSCMAVMEAGEPKVIPNLRETVQLPRSLLLAKTAKGSLVNQPNDKQSPILPTLFFPRKDS